MKKILICALFVLMVTPLVLPTESGKTPTTDTRKVVTVVLGK